MLSWLFPRKIDRDEETPEYNEQQLLKSIAGQALLEQRRARRWGIFFKLLTFAYLIVALWLVYPGFKSTTDQRKPHTALVRVEGVIAADQKASANNSIRGLRQAFEAKNAKAVLLLINSPGGSPVQAGYIYDEIVRLRALHPEKKIYAAIADLGASGGYYIAAAADEIYADKASLVGSIGVTASSFGFVESLQKLGVERRHFTAGEHKAFLDPFSPLKEEETRFWQTVLQKTHQQFIAVVKRGRGKRLNLDVAAGGLPEAELFSGLIWNGEQALGLGLVDGLGSPGYVAREVIKAENIIDYTPMDSPLELLTRRLGTAVGAGIAHSIGLSERGDSPVELR